MILTAVTDSGRELPQEICEKFFNLPAKVVSAAKLDAGADARLQAMLGARKGLIIDEITSRNKEYFDAELDKLEAWSEDLKDNLERELKALDKEIKAVKRDARQTEDLDAKIALHKKANDMERKRNEKRRALFDEQDKIDGKKDKLIEDLQTRLGQKIESEGIFNLRWSVI